MQQEIHHSDTREHAPKKNMLSPESYEKSDHEGNEYQSSKDTSFDKLLYIPALRDIEPILFFSCSPIESL